MTPEIMLQLVRLYYCHFCSTSPGFTVWKKASLWLRHP